MRGLFFVLTGSTAVGKSAAIGRRRCLCGICPQGRLAQLVGELGEDLAAGDVRFECGDAGVRGVALRTRDSRLGGLGV